MVAEEGVLPHRGIAGHGLPQRLAGHVLGHGHTEELQQGGREVDGLDEGLAVGVLHAATGIPEKEGRVHGLLIVRHRTLGPPAVLTEHIAMVGVDDEQGVLPQVMLVELIQHLAKALIAEGQQCQIVGLEVVDVVLALGDRGVGRPVQLAQAVGVEHLADVPVRCVERLMRVKGLDLEEPVVLLPVLLQKVHALRKGSGLREIRIRGAGGAVDHVLPVHLVEHLLEAFGCALGQRMAVGALRIGRGTGLPRVALLPAVALPRAVPGAVGRAAVLHIVVVVGHDPGIDAVLLEQFGHRVVKWLNGAPAAVQEVGAAGVQLPAGRHTGHTAHIAVVKDGRVRGQPLEVGQVELFAAVAGQIVQPQGIVHYHNCFHAKTSFTTKALSSP